MPITLNKPEWIRGIDLLQRECSLCSNTHTKRRSRPHTCQCWNTYTRPAKRKTRCLPHHHLWFVPGLQPKCRLSDFVLRHDGCVKKERNSFEDQTFTSCSSEKSVASSIHGGRQLSSDWIHSGCNRFKWRPRGTAEHGVKLDCRQLSRNHLI